MTGRIAFLLAIAALVLLFGGGSGGGDLADTWMWTGTDWSQLTMTTSPLPRESQGLAFDGDTGQLLLFAGSDRGALQNDTWSL